MSISPRSVVGTVDTAEGDPGLERADAVIRSLVGESLSRPVIAREPAATSAPARTRSSRKTRRG